MQSKVWLKTICAFERKTADTFEQVLVFQSEQKSKIIQDQYK